MMKLKMLNSDDVSALGQSVEVYNNSGFKCIGQPHYDMNKLQVFQTRTNGDVLFNQTWENYKYGFGEVEGDFFIGLEALSQCCPAGMNVTTEWCYLVVNTTKTGGWEESAFYKGFTIATEADHYRLFVRNGDGPSGEPGDGMIYQNNMPFSTQDNQIAPTPPECDGWWKKHGGWWHALTQCTDDPYDYTDLHGTWMDGLTWARPDGDIQHPTYTSMALLWKSPSR